MTGQLVAKSPKDKNANQLHRRSQKPERSAVHSGADASMMFLQNTIGNRAVGRFLQAKLTVNQPGDKYEQEADRVADMVMRMPESAAVKPLTGSPSKLQRKCAACASGGGLCPKCAEEEKMLQRKPLATLITPLIQRQISAGEISAVSPSVENQISVLRGSGQPLAHSVRAFFEPRFGVDFSQVRVYANSQAAGSARAANARAFTVGSDVVFGAGEYSPATTHGKRLLAHELAHTIQQKASGIQRMPIIMRVPSSQRRRIPPCTPPPCPSPPKGHQLRDPKIASGALCRGACGADCHPTPANKLRLYLCALLIHPIAATESAHTVF
jgi:hypothetical protein